MKATLTTFEIALRLVIATICGGLIGMERGMKHRPAGLRTHILVCLGSALTMMIGQYISQNINLASDPARLAAQVVSGIGFLGAGTIIVTGRLQVKGLTTAAGLWASACMGLAIGIGFFAAAFIACGLILLVIMVLHPLDERIHSSGTVLYLCVELESAGRLLPFIAKLREAGMKVSEIQSLSREFGEAQSAVFTLTLTLPKPANHDEILTQIAAMSETLSIEQI